MNLKNNMISFWRVIFTFIIMLFHFINNFGIKTYWAIAVEFFFVVSGWLLAEDLQKREYEPTEYLAHRIRRLYPEYFIAYFIKIFVVLVTGALSIHQILEWFSDTGIRELFMIHYWGWGNTNNLANSPTWYICVLLTAGYLLYGLMKRWPGITKEIILPFAIIGFLTYSYRNFKCLTEDECIGYFGHLRFFRGFAEMGIGILLHSVNEKYSYYFKGHVVRCLGCLSLISVIVMSFFMGGEKDYMYLMLISFGVIVAFNMKIHFGKRIIHFGDKISYAIFLNHMVFCWLYERYFAFYHLEKYNVLFVLSYVIMVVLLSIITYGFSKKACPIIGRKLKKIILWQ